MLIRPASTSTVEENGAADSNVIYCEPARNGGNGFTERAVIDDDKRLALVVPHGSGTTVRDHWLRFVVARGVAQAAGELISGTAPADVCDQYLP